MILCVERIEDNKYELGYYGKLKDGRNWHHVTYREDRPRFITSHVDKVDRRISDIKEHKPGFDTFY